MQRSSNRQRKPLPTYRLMFPLAALFSAMSVPAWLALQPAYGTAVHGHEMVFGFAFAVIAGFLVTRRGRSIAWALAATWLMARAAVIGSVHFPAGNTAVWIFGIAFPAALCTVTVPALLASAKRMENRILPLLIIALAGADLAWWLGYAWSNPVLQSVSLRVVVDLIALLLMLIGGRALRAAAGGHIERLQRPRRDRGQPRYEIPLAVLLVLAAAADAFTLMTAAGVFCIGAALLTLVRVLAWQLPCTLSNSAVWPLALGYVWLIPGLALKGIAQITGYPSGAVMLHGIGIGALGTLTLVMMARTAALRSHVPVSRFRDIGAAALLVSLAAIARLLVPVAPDARSALLLVSASAWSGAFLVLFIRLWRTIRT